MSWLESLKKRFSGAGAASAAAPKAAPVGDAAAARATEWEVALAAGRVPSFVHARLTATAEGKAPWIGTVTAAELLLARAHGIRPIALVSGTCWYHYGYSWTHGHSDGWREALARIKREAVVLGANAIVDVKLRSVKVPLRDSMDYTLIGTAVRVDGLAASAEPVVATVPALEFVRLLQSGIVPVGLAVGAHYEWFTSWTPSLMTFRNKPVTELGNFWERVRRVAIGELGRDAAQSGNGVLAHTHLAQLIWVDKRGFLGRFIIIGTVVDARRAAADAVPSIRPIVEMRDARSALARVRAHGHAAYSSGAEEEEAI
jgi:uncharacterized protein YbjQ (UPF0145 family)